MKNRVLRGSTTEMKITHHTQSVSFSVFVQVHPHAGTLMKRPFHHKLGSIFVVRQQESLHQALLSISEKVEFKVYVNLTDFKLLLGMLFHLHNALRFAQ